MKSLIVFFALSCCSTFLNAQISLDIKNKNVSFFRALEVANKSELITDGSDYISGDDIGQPIIFKQKQPDLPDLLTYYFPFKKDSTISYILYEWKDKDAVARPINELKIYIAKYNQLLNQVTAKYGKSQQTGNLEDLSQIAEKYLTREDSWKNDTTDIDMYITLSNKHAVQGDVSVEPTHAMRLYVRAPAKNKPEENLSKEKIDQLDGKAKLFLADLISGRFDDLKKYINPDAAPHVKNDQLDNLKNAIKDDKWELNSTGIQLTTTGKSYTNLRYSKTGDINDPPLIVLSILFDENDKIVAVQPLERMATQK